MVNLTILSSIVQILFVQQDYRAINFLTESHENELSRRILRIASDSLKPISNFMIGEINAGRKTSEEPILNVVAPNNISNEQTIKALRKNIFPDDVTLIICRDNVDVADVEQWMSLSIKVIILLVENLTILFNTFGNAQSVEIDLFPLDIESMQNSIAAAFSIEEKSIQFGDKKFYILFHYVPPKTSFSEIKGQGVVLNGPDGLLSEALMARFKVNAKFCSYGPTVQWDNKTNSLYAVKSVESIYSNVLTKIYVSKNCNRRCDNIIIVENGFLNFNRSISVLQMT